MSDWFDDYCFGWSNIPTCEFYRWLESTNQALETANTCTSAQELREKFKDVTTNDINWSELYEALNYEA